MEGGAMHEL
jgi:hypothetical protein